jgi:phospholipid N-methyltransferase
MKRPSLTVEAFKNIKQVGSIVSSSRFLAKKIIKGVDFSKNIRILELGAGTGVITREILRRMSEGSVLYSYENNQNFINSLQQICDERLIVKGECVSSLGALEDDYFDLVVSSLPLANLTNEFKSQVFREIQAKLKISGTYIQYQYSLLDYKSIEKLFNNCKVKFCLLNLPPAFIYNVSMC